jgi:hypothetical protein
MDRTRQVFGYQISMKPANAMVSYTLIALFIAVIGSFISYQLWVDPMKPTYEAFGGPVRGTGIPDCLRTSKEAAELHALLSEKATSDIDASDDFRELNAILGKLACFKRDLMSPSGIVQATRKQPFYTSHDLEPIAETTARCFAKTIPKRDLELSFDKWNTRGTMLIKRICTYFNFSEDDMKKAIGLFKSLFSDVKGVADGVCCGSGPGVIAGSPAAPRMVDGYEPSGLSFLSDYKGYY